jgi:hypothetical protein
MVFIFLDLVALSSLFYVSFLFWKKRSQSPAFYYMLPSASFFLLMIVFNLFANSLFFGAFISPSALHGLETAAMTIGIVAFLLGFFFLGKERETEHSHSAVLGALIPICSYCKKYKNEEGTWMPIEKFLHDNGFKFLTHGICPECKEREYKEFTNQKKHRLGREASFKIG